MRTTIRHATVNDLPTVQDLNHELALLDYKRDSTLNVNWPYEEGRDYFQRLVAGKIGVCFVAEVDENVVGYLAGRKRNPHTAWNVQRSEIENMFVRTEFRSQGVGQKLVNAFFEWSKANGITHVLVGAFAQNDRAIAFYQKNGFMPYEIIQEAVLE